MKLFTSLRQLDAVDAPLHLALGVFDGVHLGHQAVIEVVVAGARDSGGLAGVVTFEPHPIQVLAPEKAPRRILASLEHKERLLADLGAAAVVVLPFDREFAERSADEFCGELFAVPGLRQISVGEDWKFGKNRGGDVALLRRWGAERGVEVVPVAPVMLQGERISSTRIRQALRDDNLAGAAAMLGRPYSVMGPVIRGDQLGRQIGIPTANIEVGREQLPPDGVYAVLADTGGSWQPGIANLGMRPTVSGSNRLLEVHLFEFDGDLYGRHVEVRFGRHVRGERKFSGLDELTAQIRRDIEAVRALFAGGTAMDI
ncbi:MAG: bifunctional riboflavin kinase/FAD synthetase [Akkermansiaceae bacterium]|nr:bifunctional riboflavin kinase/FAD synthetase [Akkermansiaceae bacterium]NNM31249.1 bifunctional riboflavin kinase/FAD synthetase [Akkermansiaceae bacterium]